MPAPNEEAAPLIMSRDELHDVVNAVFEERFGRYDATNPHHVALRRKLLSNVRACNEDDSQVAVHSETAHFLRQWLAEHRR